MLMTLKRTDFRSFRFCGLFLFLLLPFGIFTVTRLGPFIYMSPSPDGHYFLIALGYRTVDLSKVVTGGQKSVLLTDNHALAFDEKGNLVFQWLCYDHFDVTGAVNENLGANSIDWVHMNSIAVDVDGNLVVSSRHLSEITKIDRQTGDVIWRLGGKYNQFAFANDAHGLSYQHCARVVEGHPNHVALIFNKFGD